jgi:hypothetical protein
MLGGCHTDHGNSVSFFIACMMKQQKRCHRAPAQRKNCDKVRPGCGDVAWTCVVLGRAVRTEETPRSQSEKHRRPRNDVPTDSWSCAATGATFPTISQRRAHGVRTSGVRLVSDVCYCSLAFVLLCTVPGLGPGGGHGRQDQRAEGQGQRGTSGHGGGHLSPRALLVVFSRRRTHHDYAHYLGKIAGRQLAGI